MMEASFKAFNQQRRDGYRKEARGENLLLEMNQVLQAREQDHYREMPLAHPLVFIFGPPRSGTTLLSQLLAHSFDLGYINNLMARFWLAPVYGIRLSQNLLGNRPGISFQSHYARTTELSNIHEFGYFWRYWLKKENLEDVTKAPEREALIDWAGLQKTLANMQLEFNRPMVFKNIFGSYHLWKMKAVLKKVLYVYIERDPLDSAVSILEARRKYYPDLNIWWSYLPLEYDLLKDRNYWEQIAGQVFFLQRYYRRQIAEGNQDITLRVSYQELCQRPEQVLEGLQLLAREQYHTSLTIASESPRSFPFRTYSDRDLEKATFQAILERLEKEYP